MPEYYIAGMLAACFISFGFWLRGELYLYSNRHNSATYPWVRSLANKIGVQKYTSANE